MFVFGCGQLFSSGSSQEQHTPSEISSRAVRLEKDVRLFSETFHPRSYRDLENLNRTADAIRKEFEASGGEVSEQAYEVNGNTYRNFIVRYNRSAAPVKIVGAHYDAHEGTPGADDNASGVAGLLELARMLGSVENGPHVELVAYTLEEPPFFASEQMGSAVHASLLAASKEPVAWMVCLEMIGYFSDAPNSQRFPDPSLRALHPTTGNFIALISRTDQQKFLEEWAERFREGTDLPLEIMAAPERMPGVSLSDHRNYWKHGIPAAMLTDTAFFRNTEYHKPDDTADRLDYQKMAQVVEGTFTVLLD